MYSVSAVWANIDRRQVVHKPHKETYGMMRSCARVMPNGKALLHACLLAK